MLDQFNRGLIVMLSSLLATHTGGIQQKVWISAAIIYAFGVLLHEILERIKHER